jgi:hypothetical protein
VIRHDEPWDLAAIAIWRPKVVPIPIAPAPPVIGEPLSILGYGKGPFRSETGPCTQYLAPGSGYPLEFVELAARARQGDSGGPILNARGELAGILFGQAQGRTIGACSTRVRAFLAGIGSQGITPEAAAALAAASGGAGVAVDRPPPPTSPVGVTPLPVLAASMTPAEAVDGAGPTGAPLEATQAGAATPQASIDMPAESGPPLPSVAGEPASALVATQQPVPAATSGEPVPTSIGPPPSAWGELPEGRPVGHTWDELLDLRRNGQAVLVATGGVVLTLAGLKTVFGGRRPARGRRRRPIEYDDGYEDD